MKYCSKCGKELLDEAVICPSCGCATNLATPEQIENHPIVRTSYGQLFKGSMLGGLIFGLFEGIIYSMMGRSFFSTFLFCGIVFGLLFFVAVALCISILESSTIKKMRKGVAIHGKILFEGAANRAGNGGWLFVTQDGIEHHVHGTNFDRSSTIIQHEHIVSIRRSGKKLVIETQQTTHIFVVNNINQWIALFAQYEVTKNKI